MSKDKKIKSLQEENLSLKSELVELKALLMLAEFSIELATKELKKMNGKNNKTSV